MNIEEKQPVKKWIMEALFRLLEKRDYTEITVGQIADEAKIGRRTFYRYFPTKDAVLKHIVDLYMNGLEVYFEKQIMDRMEDISFYYFSYWEQNADFLINMHKAGLTYMISERFEETVHNIAKRMGHVPVNAGTKSVSDYYGKYKFAFSFRLAGYWKVTEVWLQENPRRSAKEMSGIINGILKGENL